MCRGAFEQISFNHHPVYNVKAPTHSRRMWPSVIVTTLCFLILLLNVAANSLAKENPELVLQSGHTAQVSAVVFSPDDRIIASASGDNTIKPWEVETGRELLVHCL